MATLSFVQGDSAIFRIAVTDADGEPLDLSPFTCTFTIKRSRQDADGAAVFQGTLDDALAVYASTNIDVSLPAGLDMRTGRLYYWDLELRDDAQVFTPCDGAMFVTGQTTNGG